MNKKQKLIVLLMIVLLVLVQVPMYMVQQREIGPQFFLIVFLLALVGIALYFGSVVGLYSSIIYLFIIGSAIFYIQLTNHSNIQLELPMNMTEFLVYGIFILVLVLLAGRINELFVEEMQLISELKEKVSKYVAVDTESGFDNSYRMEKDLFAEVKRTNRNGKPFIFLLIEIQHFKNFQQLYGEKETTYLIKKLAESINQSMRLTDKKYRFDDEHFSLILPDTTNEYIQVIYEKLAEKMKHHQLQSGKFVTLTFKAGHFIYEPNSEVSLENIIEITKNEMMINEI